MSVSTRTLANLYASVQADQNPRHLVRGLLISSLSPQQRQVYSYVVAHPCVISSQVSAALNVPLNFASTTLYDLFTWGLLTREHVSGSGLVYAYRMTE